VVNEAEPPHDKVVEDGHKLVVDTHHADKVNPVPIAAVPGSTVADQRDRDYANRPPTDPRANASDAEITQRIRKVCTRRSPSCPVVGACRKLGAWKPDRASSADDSLNRSGSSCWLHGARAA
jgi:hypothetical protein